MKVYEAVFKEDETQGVYALSVVENPAMQDMWIALSEHPQTVELATVDNDKRLLLGAALIPNKKIYRNVDGNEFYITFKENTIEKLSHNFFKKGNQNNSSLEHNVKLKGMSVVESWIVEDPQNDKSNAFGKTYEKGTWVAMMKVDNDQMWSKVKKGEIKGFSIDALLGLQDIQLNTNINTNSMTKQDFLDAFKAIFSKEEKVDEAEKIEVVSEEVTEEVAEPTMDVNALKDALTETLAQFSENVDKKFEDFKAEFSKTVEDKDKEIEELKTELSKQPEVKPIKANPEVVDVQLTNQGRILEQLRNNK